MSLFNVIGQAIKSAPSIAPRIPIPLLIMSGESNSGGLAPNSDLSESEQGPRPALKILHNSSLVFQSLEIGVNNMIAHTDITGGIYEDTHSWENGLANMATAQAISNPTYLIKAGQGGSIISQWNNGGAYANTFNERADAAIALLGLIGDNKFALLYSQGINDRQGSWNATTWKAATIARFAYLRTHYGMFPIVMTKFMPIVNNDINILIEEICAEVEHCYYVETDDLDVIVYDIHWDYAGQKEIARRMIEKLKENGYSL